VPRTVRSTGRFARVPAAVLLLTWALSSLALAGETPRHFTRLGYVQVQINNDSGAARDITGPIVKPGDNGLLDLLGIPALGIPSNVRAEVNDAGSAVLSLGRFIDGHWAIEALVLAAPFEHEIAGAGTIARLGTVATTKQLPPTVIAHRYFGDPSSRFRASLGIGLNHTRFFSTRATPALEAYTGGPTTVKLSPSTGLGAFASGMLKLTPRWHLNLLVGYVNVKTTATVTTRETRLTNRSPVLQDQPAPVPGLATNPITGPIVNGVLGDIAQQRGGNLGTYERKIDLKLNPYVFFVSTGYSF
jgi:outer membrane protein W